MNRFFYWKLAITNIKNNQKTVIPYALTCFITTAMFYMIVSLARNENILHLPGGNSVQLLLNLGTYIVGIFAVIFLFYTNSFLMKRRKKEFGIFNILGLEKKHIAKVIGYETLQIGIGSLVAGLCFGILMDKAMFLIVTKMFQAEVILGFSISISAIRTTITLFCIIHGLILLNAIRQIHLANPIELLHSGNYGEKEPKNKWIVTFIGMLCLAGGYYISLTTKNILTAMGLFFVAVILVIIGTYLLFTTGSITLLKILKSRKHYYYKTKHFISISSMMYRMKKNAVGLANICILATMVLVMISTTGSLWFGIDDIMNKRYPTEFSVEQGVDKDKKKSYIEGLDELDQKVESVLKKEGKESKNKVMYTGLTFSVLKKGEGLQIDVSSDDISDINNIYYITFITLEDYNRMVGEDNKLKEDEILFYSSKGFEKQQTIDLLNESYTIKKRIHQLPIPDTDALDLANCFVVVPDETILEHFYEKEKEILSEKNATNIRHYISWDIDGTNEEKIDIYHLLDKTMAKEKNSYFIDCRAEEYVGFRSFYAGFLFIGVFLSILFLMATILIIYYKQISEGYEDKERFEILQKVGMDQHEVKSSIQSQIITVFFLPLLLAAVHICFAFPIIYRLLNMLYLDNRGLFIICTVICFFIFALIYSIVYRMTARIYYSIVTK